MHKLFGGFFEIDLPVSPVSNNLAEYWRVPLDPKTRFVNARSALAAFLSVVSPKPKRAWLPAYLCASLITPFDLNNIPICYYGVGDILEPDVSQLNTETQAGDLVLGVNYFGRSPHASFHDFVRSRKDLLFIEDCAQMLESELTPWGDWRLFSPRKIVGVADGGWIIPTQVMKSWRKLPTATSKNLTFHEWLAPLLRFEDEEEKDNEYWHAINQKREATQSISEICMSRLSYELLKHMHAPSIIQRRKDNFNVLYQKLSPLAFFSGGVVNFCPLGFPLRLPAQQRNNLRQALIRKNIFPATHWESLPSPSHQFAPEHLLAKELLTLPCDQRYDACDMEYIAQTVLHILSGDA